MLPTLVLSGLSVALALALPLARPSATSASLREERVQLHAQEEGWAVLSLEHRHALSDFVWLDIIQRLADQPLSLQGYTAVADLALVSTNLDPRYDVVYDATAINISTYANLPDLSDRIAKAGQVHLPKNWRMPFILGWNDYFIRGWNQEAAEHWRKASELDGAPFFLGSLAGRALRQGTGDIELSLRFLASMLETIGDERQRRAIIERMQILRSEGVLKAYDEACAAYRASEGRWPDFAGRLFLEGYTHQLPMDTLTSMIYLDTKDESRCIARSKMIPVREEEAQARTERVRERARKRAVSAP